MNWCKLIGHRWEFDGDVTACAYPAVLFYKQTCERCGKERTIVMPEDSVLDCNRGQHAWRITKRFPAKTRATWRHGYVCARDNILELQRCASCGLERAYMCSLSGEKHEVNPGFAARFAS